MAFLNYSSSSSLSSISSLTPVGKASAASGIVSYPIYCPALPPALAGFAALAF